MKKIFLLSLLILLFSILAYGISEEHSLLATVSVNAIPGTLSASPANILANAPPLSSVEKNLSFSQSLGNHDLNVTLFLEISPIKGWISFSKNNFIVEPDKTKNIIMFIGIPNVTTGAYSGNAHAITNTQDLIIPVNITVTDKYKISVKIDALEKKVKAGTNVSVLTQLTKTRQKSKDPELDGKITVDLLYNILKGKESIATLSTTMDVVDYSKKTVSIPIPINATKGSYIVEVTAAHLDKSAKDKDNFLVTPNWLRRFFNFFRFR